MSRASTGTQERISPEPADVVRLGQLALAFGRVNRITRHEDGTTPESDTDHTVMLGLIACALAERWYPHLDRGLVAQYALVHDLVEVYAGDTPTLAIDAAGAAAAASPGSPGPTPLAERAADLAQRACKACGCTENNACWPPCWWVADDLCSACQPVAELWIG